MDDFDKEHDKQIIELFNKQQSLFTILNKSDLQSKNQLFIAIKRTSSSQKENYFQTKSNNNSDILQFVNRKQIKNYNDNELYQNRPLYALKLLKYYNKRHKNNFNREKHILDLFLDEPCIIKYMDVLPVTLYNRKHILVSMHYYQNKDLLSYLWRSSYSYDENQICMVAFKILKILHLLKSRKIVHNDIKFENFIVSSEYPFEVVLTDFESAQMVNECDQSDIIAGTTIFKAPEVLERMPHDYQADIWSLGVNIFYHLYFEYPFNIQETENDESFEDIIIEKIKMNGIKRKENDKISDEAWECMLLMLEKDPIERITVENALSLKWFSNLPKQLYQNSLSSSFSIAN